MSTDKFLTIVDGTSTLTRAISSSAGVSDANKILSTDSNGLVSSTFLPSGIDLQTQLVPAYENLAAGDFVNFFDDAGTIKARKADASNNRQAFGYVLTAVTAPANATVYLSGRNSAVIGAAVGPVYLSGTTPGGFSLTSPTPGPTVILQRLGNAISATAIIFENDPITALKV